MRIGVWAHLPPGGGKRALYDHIRGLIALGHDIEVWAPPSADRSMLDLAELAPYHVVPYPKWRRRIADRIPWSVSLPARLETMKAHCMRVAEEMSQADREVILSSTCRHYAVSPLARCSELPSVLYLQEPRRQLYEAQPDNPWQLEGGPGAPPRSGPV